MTQAAAVNPALTLDSRCAPRLRRPAPGWAVAWLTVLLGIVVSAAFLNPTGWLGSDDLAYFSAAEHVLSGQQLDQPDHHAARSAVVLPIALSLWLFGKSATAVVLPSIIAATLCVALVAVLGRQLWGWWEGLLAASIIATLPYFRVLSTAGYPDVHTCLWTTLAVVAAIAAAQSRKNWATILAGLACGCSLGLAVSTKLFAALAFVGVVTFLVTYQDNWPRRLRSLGWVIAGGLVVVLADAAFYTWLAGDPAYKLHSINKARGNDVLLAMAGYDGLRETAKILWQRGTLLLRPAESGWGVLAVGFWPAALAVFAWERRGRALVLWAIAVYLLIAFVPMSFKNGVHPFPRFHGRHILTAAVPFALCLAWSTRHLLSYLSTAERIERLWPAMLLAVIAIASVRTDAADRFRDRHTRAVGQAVACAVGAIDRETERPIVVTPAMYLRFRILFPVDLQTRLMVAADPAAPEWWRSPGQTLPASRTTLPTPGQAYLLATPAQLAGETEWWDYEVGLPTDHLDAWRRTLPLMIVVRNEDGTVGRAADEIGAGVVLIVLGTP